MSRLRRTLSRFSAKNVLCSGFALNCIWDGRCDFDDGDFVEDEMELDDVDESEQASIVMPRDQLVDIPNKGFNFKPIYPISIEFLRKARQGDLTHFIGYNTGYVIFCFAGQIVRAHYRLVDYKVIDIQKFPGCIDKSTGAVKHMYHTNGNGVAVGNKNWSQTNKIATAYHIVAPWIDGNGKKCDSNGFIVGKGIQSQSKMAYKLEFIEIFGVSSDVDVIDFNSSNDLACLELKSTNLTQFMSIGHFDPDPSNIVMLGYVIFLYCLTLYELSRNFTKFRKKQH